ncbi:hypothetical protein Y032_0089g2220 [Ancylostoma ceylanicum]|uniref:Nucleotide-diphospho-sugar transferase domain-containing protein n=1 Tax=Ancylostoma ceylanicum TaxID=53326 RepID=A0A016TNT2_9BILA|nr:hypothetical protein Y032_0089g2220 [Ancylostoma ceylanicum]
MFIASIACYARVWKYDFRVVNSSDYRNECPHKDKYFRRHCVAARILSAYDYILFLDADIGVVNPKKRIEDFLDAKAEMIFYDRFFNWEVMAGAYLAKNTDWTKHFLDEFANYEFRLPKSFHGTDNGALHAYLAEVILGVNNAGLAPCLYVYAKSKNFDDLFMYEACIRKLLGNTTHFGHIKILRKGTAWARDNWMTNSLWNPERDFMMHNWKFTQLRTYKSTPLPVARQQFRGARQARPFFSGTGQAPAHSLNEARSLPGKSRNETGQDAGAASFEDNVYLKCQASKKYSYTVLPKNTCLQHPPPNKISAKPRRPSYALSYVLRRDSVDAQCSGRQVFFGKTITPAAGLEARSYSEWYNPLAGQIDLPRCTPGNTSWSYDSNLVATREVIDKRLDEFASGVERQREASLASLSKYLSKTT